MDRTRLSAFSKKKRKEKQECPGWEEKCRRQGVHAWCGPRNGGIATEATPWHLGVADVCTAWLYWVTGIIPSGQREEAGSKTCREKYRAGWRSAEPIIGSLISMNFIVEVFFVCFWHPKSGVPSGWSPLEKLDPKNTPKDRHPFWLIILREAESKHKGTLRPASLRADPP